jgi:phage FluMu protein Com
MEILEHGPGRIQVCTGEGNQGNGCGAKLSYVEEDIFYTFRHVMGEAQDYFLTIKCPHCETLTDIKRCHKKPDYPSKSEWEAGARKQHVAPNEPLSDEAATQETTDIHDEGPLRL